jgi:hypothetical protein
MSARTRWAPVTLKMRADGEQATHTVRFDLEFKIPSRARIRELASDVYAGAVEGSSAATLIAAAVVPAIVGWRGIDDHEGNPLPFDRKYRDMLWRTWPVPIWLAFQAAIGDEVDAVLTRVEGSTHREALAEGQKLPLGEAVRAVNELLAEFKVPHG